MPPPTIQSLPESSQEEPPREPRSVPLPSVLLDHVSVPTEGFTVPGRSIGTLSLDSVYMPLWSRDILSNVFERDSIHDTEHVWVPVPSLELKFIVGEWVRFKHDPEHFWQARYLWQIRQVFDESLSVQRWDEASWSLVDLPQEVSKGNVFQADPPVKDAWQRLLDADD